MEIGQYIYKTQFVIWKSESYPDVKQLPVACLYLHIRIHYAGVSIVVALACNILLVIS
jgi:hypothetical protein